MAVSGASGGVVGSAQTDITNPYETIPCGCIYCFVCITKKLESEEGEGWVCLRCGELSKECRPWAGEVLEEPSVSANKKSVSFFDRDTSHAGEEKDIGYNPSKLDQSAHPGDKGSETEDSEALLDSQEWAQNNSDSGIDIRTDG